MELSGKSRPALYSRLPVVATPSATLHLPDTTLVTVEGEIGGPPLLDGTIPIVTMGGAGAWPLAVPCMSLLLLAAPWYVSWLRLGWAHSQTPDRSQPQSQSVEETQMQKHQQLPNLLEAKRPRIKMPSFEAVSICRAGHSIVVQYVLRNWKCKSIVQIC